MSYKTDLQANNTRLDNLKTEINNLPTYVDTSTATATASDILSGKSGYVNGVKVNGSLETETKTVKSTTTSQIITPTTGKLINEITVEPISLQNKTVTPKIEQQIITADEGYNGLEEVTINSLGVNAQSINDVNYNLTSVVSMINQQLQDKIALYPVYTEQPVTLYTPSLDATTYFIRKSSDKYSIIWSKTASVKATLPNGATLQKMTILGRIEKNNYYCYLNLENGTDGFYYSNAFNTIEELIEAVTSSTGNITYTKYSNESFGRQDDSGYAFSYTNTIVFDYRDNSGNILNERRISQNETYTLKS